MTFQCYVTCSMGGSINTKFRCASFQGILNYELPINRTASERSCSCIPLCYTHTCTCTHTHTHGRAHACAHTHAHTCTYTRAHTHTHTRARVRNDKRVAIYTDSKITLDLLKNNFKRNRLIEYITYLLTYLLHGAESFLRSQPVNFAASQEIPRISGTRKSLTVPTSARHLS
jgi:hypothetical protein